MPPATVSDPPSVALTTPRQLARRIADGDPPVVVDVRDRADHAAWRICAPGLTLDLRSLPLDIAPRGIAALAAELGAGAEVVVAGYIEGDGAPVAEALRARGLEASLLDGGMTAWGRFHRPVRLRRRVPGLKIVQVMRVARGCLSYVIGMGETAVVVDPGVDAEGYIGVAENLGVEIRTVLETHLHADHLSGARPLARATGAELLVPEGLLARNVTYGGEVSAIRDGDVVGLEDIELRAIALPGHTAEMTGYLVAGSALLSGDSLYADGLARPEASGAEARELARQLHAALRERVFPLGGRTRLLPGHYGGGVRRLPVAPTLAEAHRASPEIDLDAADFADRIAAGATGPSPRHRAILEANAGRAPAAPELEAGAALDP